MNYQTTKCEFLGSVKISPVLCKNKSCLLVESQNEKDRILEIKGRQDFVLLQTTTTNKSHLTNLKFLM
jgi:hypothetical protein